MRRWGLGLLGGVVAGWACGSGAFDCIQASDCANAGVPGECIAGYCAFPDDGCESGLRYGQHSGPASGACVPPVSDDTGSTSAGEATDPSATSALPTAGDVDTEPTLDSSDGPGPGEVELTDDELDGEFGAGLFDGTEWQADHVTLVPGGTQGTFVSRVYDAGREASWDTLRWWPRGPYGKRLPDGGQGEGYPEGSVSMDGSVLLMHFDEGALLADGDPVPDSSGAGSDGTVVSSGGPIALVPGVFGTAIDDHIASRIAIPTASAPGLSFGEDDFSWSLWFRFEHACAGNNVFMGVDNADGDDAHPHLWLGCTDDQWDECAGTVSAPRAAGGFRSVHSDDTDGVFFCSDDAVRGGIWHHVLATKRGHPDTEVVLYLDGDPQHTGSGTMGAPMVYPDDPDFSIGAFSRGTYPSEGVLDEVAIWTRALDEGEVLDVYRRGVTRLELAVRSCTQLGCSDGAPWVEGFVDPAGSSGPGTELLLSELPPGRYVQYRVSMVGAGWLPGPALDAVTIRGHQL
ncbi:MAG: LamG domain-containing protein [Myxococcales bacterium]|nr:LamG domain-containing protein [Myxococcales bacterium]